MIIISQTLTYTTSMGKTLFWGNVWFSPQVRGSVYVCGISFHGTWKLRQDFLAFVSPNHYGKIQDLWKAARSTASVKLQHCHLCLRCLFPGHLLAHPGLFSQIIGVLPGDVLSPNTGRTCKPQNIPETLLSFCFRAPCLHSHCLLFLIESFFGLNSYSLNYL